MTVFWTRVRVRKKSDGFWAFDTPKAARAVVIGWKANRQAFACVEAVGTDEELNCCLKRSLHRRLGASIDTRINAMITAQQEHKSRWRGRYWRRVELELVDSSGAVVLDGGGPKALVRISDEGSVVVRVEIADVAAYEAARQACVLPRTETLRLRGAGLFEALDAHRRRRSTAVPPPEPPERPAPRPPVDSGPPPPPEPGTDATDAAPTVGALEARLTKLQRSDLEQRRAESTTAGAARNPPRRLMARSGTGPRRRRPRAFETHLTTTRTSGAREKQPRRPRVFRDDLLECLAAEQTLTWIGVKRRATRRYARADSPPPTQSGRRRGRGAERDLVASGARLWR